MKIIAVGDTILSDAFFKSNSYEELINYFNTGDIFTFNLETVIATENLKAEDKAVCFKATENNLKHFSHDITNKLICNIANNHIFDFGEKGYQKTKYWLEKHNISYVGEKSNVYITKINDKKIAVIGAYESEIKELNSLNDALIYSIQQITKKVDYCIVHIHWGRELSLGISEVQRDWAHKIIAAGCNIIIGHHPHVLQGIEKYREGYIFYSLGNFQIPINPYEKLSTISMVLEISIDENNAVSYNYTPIRLNNDGIPTIGDKCDYNIITRILKEATNEIIHFSKVKYYLNFSSIYIKESFRAWKMRINKQERNIYKSFFKWICSGIAIKAFCFMLIDKIIGYTKKRNNRIWVG